MKKSELRNIIRESIKQLVKEQNDPNTRCVRLSRCTPGASQAFKRGNHTVDGQVPQLGQIIQTQGGPSGRYAIYKVLPYSSTCGTEFDVQESTSTDPCDACNHISGGCPGLSTPSGCDPSAWPNHANWTASWPNSGPFTISTNPLQPCTHICGQIQNWTNNLTTAGPVQANQLNCKIDEGNNQAQIHGCNC